MNKPRFVVAVDIGGTRTKYGLVNLATGELAAVVMRPSQYSKMEEFVTILKQVIAELLQTAQIASGFLTAIGLGVPGFIDGDFISQVWKSMEFIEGSHFRPFLQQVFQLPVAIENDARAIALAEYYYGGNGNPDRLLSLTLGTGVGFGFIVKGALHEKNSLSHMAGHILIRPGAATCYCGLNGCLESLVNGQRLITVYDHFRKPIDNVGVSDTLDAKMILNAAARQYQTAEQPGPALAAVNEMIQDLITGLNVYIYQYAPNLVVFGGGLAQGLPTFLQRIENGLIAEPYHGFRAQVRISQLGERAGLLGAASLCREMPD
jgi:glucokinase